ncbi:MAG: hypothetical protein R3C68_16450 [Myxococcota bacterium]
MAKEVTPNMATMTSDWLGTAAQMRGERHIIRIVAHKFDREEEAALEAFFGNAESDDVFIVVDAADDHNQKIRESTQTVSPYSEKIRQVVARHRFHTSVIALESEVPSVRGSCDFLLAFPRTRG